MTLESRWGACLAVHNTQTYEPLIRHGGYCQNFNLGWCPKSCPLITGAGIIPRVRCEHITKTDKISWVLSQVHFVPSSSWSILVFCTGNQCWNSHFQKLILYHICIKGHNRVELYENYFNIRINLKKKEVVGTMPTNDHYLSTRARCCCWWCPDNVMSVLIWLTIRTSLLNFL